jgi:hypothetical protein
MEQIRVPVHIECALRVNCNVEISLVRELILRKLEKCVACFENGNKRHHFAHYSIFNHVI